MINNKKDDFMKLSHLNMSLNDLIEASITEISTPALTQYKTAAGKDASSADKAGNTARANKRFSGIIKATNKQFDNDKKTKDSDVKENKFEFNKRTGQMGLNKEDPDQRHGLFLNGKLVKTYNTKEEADNIAKRDPRFAGAIIKKIAETLGAGINRSAPAQAVSYEHVLDEISANKPGGRALSYQDRLQQYLK